VLKKTAAYYSRGGLKSIKYRAGGKPLMGVNGRTSWNTPIPLRRVLLSLAVTQGYEFIKWQSAAPEKLGQNFN